VSTTPFNVGVDSQAPPGSGGPAPTIVGARVVTAGKGGHQHLVGFEVDFSSVLDSAHATEKTNYTVTQTVRRGRRLVAQAVKFKVRYNPGSDAVSLLVSGRPAFAKGGRIALNAAPPSGITDSFGDYLAGNTVFVILPGARSVRG
jgi:hypothetical protein